MSVQIVPLSPVANQTLSVVLNDRSVGITVRTLGAATYIDVAVAGLTVCAGQACRDRVPLTPRAAYLGLADLSLVFADLRGTSDPVWTEFGTRYVLLSVGDPTALDPILAGVSPDVPALLYDGSVTYNGSRTFNGQLA